MSGPRSTVLPGTFWLRCHDGDPQEGQLSSPTRTRRYDARRLLGDRVLLERYLQRRDPRDREMLVERFLPLARGLARRYQRTGEPFDDLFQVACLGLVKAIDRFDPNRDVAFSSYAVPTMLGEIRRYLRDRTWSVRVPRGLQELALRVETNVVELSSDVHRQPTVAEIARAVAATEEQVIDALQACGAYRATSLETPPERFVRTVRGECLDRLLILNRRHLERVLRVYVEHYNTQRPHRALDLQPPQPAEPPPTPTIGEIHRHDRLGGLIHEYDRDAA